MLEKFVFITHTNNKKQYIFRVPEDLNLLTGDIVMCDTKFGERVGVCASDSFLAQTSEDILRDTGVSRDKLKSVLWIVQRCEPQDEAEHNICVRAEVPKELNVTFDSFL